MQVTAIRESHRLRSFGFGLAAASMLIWSGVANAATPDSFSGLAKKVAPAVVNILSMHEVSNTQRGAPELPFAFPEGSPFEKFFRQYGAPGGSGQPETRKAMGQGSGFIVDESGYIVTNNHVVKDSVDVKVRMDDDQVYPATIVGVDPKTDLALLKIDAKRSLPTVKFGNSDTAEVGDWVMAVGNPFGLGGMVTTGIVSARGRNIQSGPYDDYLQIDASINRGNSGGPLFNMDGAVIGINSAIYSPNGGNVGIGFAIPSNLAKSVIAQLRENGRVERGWLGVQIQPVSPGIAEATGLETAEGAIVSGVMVGSPAEKAGLKTGDVVTRVGENPVAEPRDLARLIAAQPAGSKVAVTVWRDRAAMNLLVVTGDQPADKTVASRGGRPDGSVQSSILKADLGVLTAERRKMLGLDDSVEGVVVLDVSDQAAAMNVRPGDVIRRIAGAPVSAPEDVDTLMEKSAGKSVLILVTRQGRDLFVGVPLKIG